MGTCNVLGLTGLQEGREGRKDVYYDVMMSFLFVVYYLIGYLYKVGTCLGGGCIHVLIEKRKGEMRHAKEKRIIVIGGLVSKRGEKTGERERDR